MRPTTSPTGPGGSRYGLNIANLFDENQRLSETRIFVGARLDRALRRYRGCAGAQDPTLQKQGPSIAEEFPDSFCHAAVRNQRIIVPDSGTNVKVRVICGSESTAPPWAPAHGPACRRLSRFSEGTNPAASCRRPTPDIRPAAGAMA